MKRIIHIIAFVATMLAAVSCVEPFNTFIPSQDLTLSFSNGAMTKATVDGIDNENLVKKIDYFIFPLNANGELLNGENTEYVFTNTIGSGTSAVTMPYTVTIDRSELAAIFPNGTKAMVFAVANFVDKYGTAVESPNTTIPTTAKTWKALHELEVGESFFKDGGAGFELRWPRKMEPNDPKLFFVMTGEKVIDMYASADDNTVPLERLASKVTVQFTFVPSITDSKGIIWEPQYTGASTEARVFLSNAIEHTTLGGPLTRTLVADSWAHCTKPQIHDGTAGDGTRDIFEYAYDFLNKITPASDGTIKAHYYTYPISMKEGDDNQPYLKLVLPWFGYKMNGDEKILYKQKEVYYKIVLPAEKEEDKYIIKGNRIYEYAVTVNIIGNEQEVLIDGEYQVKDWPASNEISSNVATGRYISLDIPKDEYDMYVDEIDIAFVSSGKVKAIIDEIYQLDLAGSSPTPQYFMQNDAVVASSDLLTKKGVTAEQIEKWVTIPDGASYLKINHAMDNRLMVNNQKNNAFDMAPYIFKVTLHLEDAGDDHTFDRHVTITQYPSMYVTSTKSNGSVWVNNYKYGTTAIIYNSQQELHYSFAYNSNGTGSNDNIIGSITYADEALTTSTNNNGYNMIVHPTVVDASLKMGDGSSYILGDSRVAVGSALANITPLSNYRATRTDVSSIVSPGFMIASSYGKTSPMLFDRAKERCASYQENGYPAGRWRLPSPGEIEFLVTLSNNGFIPSLFDGTYWAANGEYYNSEDSSWNEPQNENTTQYVRCVYDTWYWGEEPYQANATSWLGFQDN